MDASLPLPAAAAYARQNFPAVPPAACAAQRAAFSDILAFLLADKPAPPSLALPGALPQDSAGAALPEPAPKRLPSLPGIALPEERACCGPAAPALSRTPDDALPKGAPAPPWPGTRHWITENSQGGMPCGAPCPSRRIQAPPEKIHAEHPDPAQILCAAAALAPRAPLPAAPAAAPDSRSPFMGLAQAFPGLCVSAEAYPEKAGPGLRVAADLPGGHGLFIEARMAQGGEPALRVFTDSPLAAAALAGPGSPLGPQSRCELVDGASLRKMRRRKSQQGEPPEASLLENIMASKAYCA